MKIEQTERIKQVKERVITVIVRTDQSEEWVSYAQEEMTRLVDTAGGQVVATLVQKRERYDRRTMIGKGKLEELSWLVEEQQADTVIFYHELTATLVRNIEEVIEVKVLDRVQLILDIFALRARSKEGKLQVELAQLHYLLPRLSSAQHGLSRLGGGIGIRGPGETKLETDRRHIRRKIQDTQQELEVIQQHRQRTRAKRQESFSFQFGLIGYTNAGKSTILNALTAAETYEQDQLFATLDPLTRKMKVSQLYDMTVTDTVGFIQDLPTQLIYAFRSTLEESRCVDMLVHVVDASSPYALQQERTVLRLLEELEMEQLPIVTVYNKMDKVSTDFHPQQHPSVAISIKNSWDQEVLSAFLVDEMKKVLIPYDITVEVYQQKELVVLQQATFVEDISYVEEKNKYRIIGYSKRPVSDLLQM